MSRKVGAQRALAELSFDTFRLKESIIKKRQIDDNRFNFR